MSNRTSRTTQLSEPFLRAARRLPIDFKEFPVAGRIAVGVEEFLTPSAFDRVDDGLYVGNSRGGRDYPDQFEYRVSVAEDLEFTSTTHSFDLVPTDSTRRNEFADAVETVQELSTRGTTLVHCYEGKERAPTVAATVLALENDWDFGRSVHHIREHRPITEPTSELRALAREYLQEQRP